MKKNIHHSFSAYCYTFDEPRECVNCGAAASAQNTRWSKDGSGFNLCSKCGIYSSRSHKIQSATAAAAIYATGNNVDRAIRKSVSIINLFSLSNSFDF